MARGGGGGGRNKNPRIPIPVQHPRSSSLPQIPHATILSQAQGLATKKHLPLPSQAPFPGEEPSHSPPKTQLEFFSRRQRGYVPTVTPVLKKEPDPGLPHRTSCLS